MRVFGGHDFYDGALAFGQDKELVFQRSPFDKAKTIPISEAGLTKEPKTLAVRGHQLGRNPESFRLGDAFVTIEPVVVWFAGKRFGGFRVYQRFWASSAEPRDDYYWSEENFTAFLDQNGLRVSKETYMPNRDIDSRSLSSFFQREPTRAETEWLIEQRVSTAMLINRYRYENGYHIDTSEWVIDSDGLKDWQFAKCLDPYSAYQELSMWIGGVLPRRENPTVTITGEKAKLQQHGFDKWSFKKMPSQSNG